MNESIERDQHHHTIAHINIGKYGIQIRRRRGKLLPNAYYRFHIGIRSENSATKRHTRKTPRESKYNNGDSHRNDSNHQFLIKNPGKLYKS